MAEGNPQGRGQRAASGLLLLFAPGERPDRDAIGAVIGQLDRVSIAFDPQKSARSGPPARQASGGDGGAHWLELMSDGLTFDVFGIAPSAALSLPEMHYRVGIETGALAGCEAIGLFAGPHIAEGAHTLPVMRTMARIGAGLADALAHVHAVVWTPANLAVAPDFFGEAISRWLEGGPFPGLCFVGLRAGDSGALKTTGMDFFIGREVELAADLAADKPKATRLMMRLIHQFVGSEIPEEARSFAGPEGEPLLMEPGEETGPIRIRPG